MKRMLVVGNWKMHFVQSQARDLVTTLAQDVRVGAALADGVGVVCCPPFTSIPIVHAALDGAGIGVGAQNCHAAASGAHTGDISVPMLVDAGCSHVIIGHSERRRDHGEADADVAAKTSAVLQAGLTPIVCVGETLEQRDEGITMQVIDRQLDAVMPMLTTAPTVAVIAYEPVWAIGTGRAATPSQAEEVHLHIAERLAGHDLRLPILYGGSVTAENAAELFVMPHIAGGLVGGASLKADAFASIVAAAHAVAGAAS